MVKRPEKPTKRTGPVKATKPQKPKGAGGGGRKITPGPTEMLHLGLWISALELKQIDVAEKSGFGRAYINNLINPKKERHRNPSAIALLRISRAIGVTVNELFELPPSKAELSRLRRLRPETLGNLVDTMR